mgnify:CR=1 FL=1
MHYSELDTPALAVDLDGLENNIETLQRACNDLSIDLRVHTKTHKTPQIARMQVAAGAIGIVSQKLGEAQAMAAAGMEDILIVYNIVGKPKLERLTRLVKSGTTTLTLAMLRDGRPGKYVPIQYQRRVGMSKIRPVRDLYLFLMLIIRTVVYFNPLKVFLPMSLSLLGLGTGVLVWRVLFRSNIGQFELLCLLVGVQVGLMGLLADLFVRHIKGMGGR